MQIRERQFKTDHLRPQDEADILAMIHRLGFDEQLEVTDEEGTYLIHKDNYARKNGTNQNGNGGVRR